MLVDLAAGVSQARFGELVGIGQPTVADLVARGVLQRDGRAGEWLIAYTSHLREQAAGRAEPAPLAAERRRLVAAKAAIAEMEARRCAGELLDRRAVERATFATWRTVRDAVLAVPDRLGPVLAGEADAGACIALLAAELADTLRSAAAAIGDGDPVWIDPLSRALGREIGAWGRAAGPEVSGHVATLCARVEAVCVAFARGALPEAEREGASEGGSAPGADPQLEGEGGTR